MGCRPMGVLQAMAGTLVAWVVGMLPSAEVGIPAPSVEVVLASLAVLEGMPTTEAMGCCQLRRPSGSCSPEPAAREWIAFLVNAGC